MAKLRFLTLAFAAATITSVAAQQHEMTSPTSQRYHEPIKLYTVGLGPFARPISSTNAEAQKYFNQGFQMMYAFAKAEAVRSFREAWKRDPDCAICYWGEGWAMGSYLNGAMTAPESPLAYEATQKALALKSKGSEKERDFIDALSVRYVQNFDASKRIQQDRAYAEAMRKLSAKYPDDLDAMTLYGDALFLLLPRRGYRNASDSAVRQLHQVLEAVLAKDIKHPGACHLYVHATESTLVAGRAEPCAEFLGSSIPGASHINHMPSHTWSQTGRWGDAVRANIEAWQSDLKAAKGEGFAIYPEHNLHMLAFAASMDGQGAVATKAGKDYSALRKDTIYEVLTLVRFGKFAEIAAVTARPSSEVSAGLWDFAQGYARLRTGDTTGANEFLAKVKKAADSSKAAFRGHPAKVLLGVVGGILEGELLRSDDKLKYALKAFEKAVKAEDKIDYDEPEPLPFSARHWLGAALLDLERPHDAERVYLEDLKKHPHNGWSLFGLKQALLAQGKPTADVDRDLASSWARADVVLTSSRY